MALAMCSKLPRFVVRHENVVHKNRSCVVVNKRRCSCSIPASQKPCSSRACKEKRRKPFWKTLFSRKSKEEDPFGEKPPIECCKVKYKAELEQDDPDFSALGGKAYKTCGRAYVIQRDMLPEKPSEVTKEEVEVKRLEIHPDLKNFLDDPVPQFDSAAGRLVEISNRRLHPLYDKYRHTPKHRSPIAKKCPTYRTISGPIDLHDVPLNIKFNKNLLERKNLYAEYKRVEPPRDVLGRLVEMNKNSKTLFEFTKKEIVEEKPERVVSRERRVFDTLKQDKKT